MGVELDIKDWEIGHDIPLLVNMQPAGEYLGEEFHRAGGVPAVIKELIKAGRFHEDALDRDRQDHGREPREGAVRHDRKVIRPYEDPLMPEAGFVIISGNLFDSAVMKTSVVTDEFKRRYLEHPDHPGMFEGRAIVFEGPEDYHHRIDDDLLDIDEDCFLFIRNCGPVGLSGRGRGGQHAAADDAHQEGHQGAADDRRRPAERHLGEPVDPQRLAGSGDRRQPRHRQDRRHGAARPAQPPARPADPARGDRAAPGRGEAASAQDPAEPDALAGDLPQMVGQLSTGACLEPAVLHLKIVETYGTPRRNH